MDKAVEEVGVELVKELFSFFFLFGLQFKLKELDLLTIFTPTKRA